MFHKKIPARWCFGNLMPRVFYSPTQSRLHNNLLVNQQHKTPFYAALYAKLSAIDRGLANEITLSLAF